MTSFADRIRESAKRKVKTPAPMQKAGSITSQIQAQQTGKQTAAAPTGQSNIASQIAAATPSPVEAQTQQQAEQLAGAERQEDIKQQGVQQQIDSQRAQIEQKATQSALDLMGNMQASNKQLEARSDGLELEQAATALRMQDKEYQAQLARIATENNASDATNFNEMMRKNMIGEESSSVLDKIDFNEAQASQKRQMTWEQALSNITKATAIAQAQVRDREKAAKIGAMAQAAKTGISYGADNDWFSGDKVASDPTTYQGPATEGSASNVNKDRG